MTVVGANDSETGRQVLIPCAVVLILVSYMRSSLLASDFIRFFEVDCLDSFPATLAASSCVIPLWFVFGLCLVFFVKNGVLRDSVFLLVLHWAFFSSVVHLVHRILCLVCHPRADLPSAQYNCTVPPDSPNLPEHVRRSIERLTLQVYT